MQRRPGITMTAALIEVPRELHAPVVPACTTRLVARLLAMLAIPTRPITVSFMEPLASLAGSLRLTDLVLVR